MNKGIITLVLLFTTTPAILAQGDMQDEVNKLLNDWHLAAAEADFEGYFGRMTSQGVFIGTDATENWQNEAFRTFSKPYFDKGKAWSFKAVERNIYFDKTQQVAWFDELLDTWMGICRGSGTLIREGDDWRIAHYVLSATIPNDDIDKVIQLKKETDSLLLKDLQLKADQKN